MKKEIVIILIALLLTSCSEVRYAKANRIRQQTRRVNNAHQQQMSDNQATQQARIDMKTSILYSSAVGFSIIILITAATWGYYVIGIARAEVRKRNIIQLVDPQGRRFPVLITATNLVNISTGERFLLNSTNDPQHLLVSSSTAVQLREPVKFISGEVK